MGICYLDYNATTPLDPGIARGMLAEGVFANPSSIHHLGRRARAVLDDARDRVARLWKCKPSEIVFTSGGTESNNLALLGTARRYRERGRHLVTSAVEHHAVLEPLRHLEGREGFDLTVVRPDAEGRIDPDCIEAAIRPDTLLVSVMAANNEIGTLQPVEEIGARCRAKGVIFHADAAQWFGKEPVASIDQFNADLVSVCGHKFHGPKGGGALFVRSPLQPDPLQLGGGQENERRGGTENLPAILGLAAALEAFTRVPVFDRDRLEPLADCLIALLRGIAGCEVLCTRAPRLANTVAAVFDGCDSLSLLAGLDLEGVCASSGAACTTGALEPSHVVRALGQSEARAGSLVRFSLGRETTMGEVRQVGEVLPGIVRRIRGQ